MYFTKDNTYNDIRDKSLNQWLSDLEAHEDIVVHGGVKLAKEYLQYLKDQNLKLQEEIQLKNDYLKKMARPNMKLTVEGYKKELNMKPHEEGGFFSQSYLEPDGQYSSIYFLLETGEVSHFHQLKGDEIWYYHDGNSLDIYEITPDGQLNKISLGKNVAEGEVLQYCVKKGSIFGSIMKNKGFSLVGCMISPAFTYEHFKLFSREELLKKYPDYKDVIIALTYDE